jgi:hypothetical protein
MESIQLQCLVNKLVAEIAPATSKHRSFLVNDIPDGMQIATNPDAVTAVLGQLFVTLANHATDSCIRISAKTYNDILLVQLRDGNSPTAYTIAQGLYPAQIMAERIGGYLGVTSQRKHETTIVFSFPNVKLAS